MRTHIYIYIKHANNVHFLIYKICVKNTIKYDLKLHAYFIYFSRT